MNNPPVQQPSCSAQKQYRPQQHLIAAAIRFYYMTWDDSGSCHVIEIITRLTPIILKSRPYWPGQYTFAVPFNHARHLVCELCWATVNHRIFLAGAEETSLSCCPSSRFHRSVMYNTRVKYDNQKVAVTDVV